MRASQAIARADELRMNTIPEEQKAAWLYDLDGQLSEMMDTPVPKNRWPERDGALLMPAPHEEIYPLYLAAKIDYYNQEMNLYANDMILYNAALSEAQAWWRRHHRPKPSGRWKVW